MASDPIRILLVEDSPSDAYMAGQVLRQVPKLAFTLAHEPQFGKGLERLRTEEFDVLLLDLSLPDVRGLETVTRAVAEAGEVPVVVLTGQDDDSLGLEAVRLGAQDFIVKGEVDGWRMVRRLRYAIERKRHEHDRDGRGPQR